MQFKQVYIDNKILGTFLQSGTYNNYDFSSNRDIFTNFSKIIDKINANYSSLMDFFPLFAVVTADNFIGYCESTDIGNKSYYTLKTDVDIGDYIILSDYILNTINCGINQFNPTSGFNADTQFLAVNKMFVDLVIPQYKMQCNSINISLSADNISIKTAIPGYFDITMTNFIGKTFLDYDESTGNPKVFKKFNTSHTSIYKLNQLFYNIVQTNYVTTIPTALTFRNLNNYEYVTINQLNSLNNIPLYLTYDSSKVDTSQNVLECLSIDQTLPRLKVLPVQIPLPNDTYGIAYNVPPGVNNNIFTDLWIIGIESINLDNTPIKLYKQYELLQNSYDIVKNGGIHNLGYPFVIFDTDGFSINKYIRQQLPSFFGFDLINNKILHLTNSNIINNVTTKPVFDDVKYKFPGSSNGLKIYIGNHTYLNNVLSIMSGDSLNNNVFINIAWYFTGLQCLIPIYYIVGIDTNIKTIILDNMEFTINFAEKWTQTVGDINTDYIWCIIKIFGPVVSNALLSSEKQSVTIPQTIQKTKITTPTLYIPQNIDYTQFSIIEEPPTTTTMPPTTTTMSTTTTTTMPPTRTTMPPTTTTMPPTTTTTMSTTTTTMPPTTTTIKSNKITSAEYDEIIQRYRGNPIYNINTSMLSYDNNYHYNTSQPITTNWYSAVTNKPLVPTVLTTLPDDILNYYGNIILDKEGIETIKQNKYLDDLLKQ